MWVARNKEGSLWLFRNKPIRTGDNEYDETENEWWDDFDSSWFGACIDDNLFPDLKWEDEPIEVIFEQVPNEDTVHTNIVFKSIFDFGKKEGIREHNERLREYYKKPAVCENCINNGHPYCQQGILCDDYEFNPFNII